MNLQGNPDTELVEVWEAHGELAAQLICGLLESCGIEASIRGESIRLTHPTPLNELGRVSILVRREDEAEAREILASLDSSPSQS